ncbi:uncharacterized protein B0H18DRAFT_1115620 [Fomitopsis serialis]|uniref:uncharacterized protein n=1 Tax=Fomitopsis serialis TaxID=139415 RepID=UPI002008E197|nr:uncharacterized protein B0H18DRAFT_1115620 [Neoantrodia serialis]KAH9932980.1 hypothetical protein B0H18DRAFT_1115620 [Neoantrodia serialis]
MSTDWPIVVQDVPGKGKGVIATRPITAGELVLLEAPLFTLPSEYDNSAVLAKLVALTGNNFWEDTLHKISFRALKDVAEGEELCICYTEPSCT